METLESLADLLAEIHPDNSVMEEICRPDNWCPICGYQWADEPYGGSIEYHICSCCGIEFGVDSGHYAEDRKRWIANGGKWWFAQEGPPADFDPRRQLERLARRSKVEKQMERADDLLKYDEESLEFLTDEEKKRLACGYDAAFRDVDTAVKEDPGWFKTWLLRGIAHELLGRKGEAREDYERAHALCASGTGMEMDSRHYLNDCAAARQFRRQLLIQEAESDAVSDYVRIEARAKLASDPGLPPVENLHWLSTLLDADDRNKCGWACHILARLYDGTVDAEQLEDWERWILRLSKLVPHDPSIAFALYQRSSDLAYSVEGAIRLAEMLVEGHGVARDVKLALMWLEIVAPVESSSSAPHWQTGYRDARQRRIFGEDKRLVALRRRARELLSPEAAAEAEAMARNYFPEKKP